MDCTTCIHRKPVYHSVKVPGIPDLDGYACDNKASPEYGRYVEHEDDVCDLHQPKS